MTMVLAGASPAFAAGSRPGEYVPVSQLIGMAFHDADGDGVRSAGESGIDGITIEVVNALTSAVVGKTTTAGGGSFLVVGLPIGKYRVIQRTPWRWFAPKAEMTVQVEPLIGARVTFANRLRGEIVGRVFFDADADGQLDPEDYGIEDALITIQPSSSASRTTRTDDEGGFRFEGIEPGTVRVQSEYLRQLSATSPLAVVTELADGGRTEVTFGFALDRPVPARIVEQPADVVVDQGNPASLSVLVEGEGSFEYQWLKDDAPLPSATNAIWSVASARPADAGLYRVEIRNAGGTTRSREARITVTPSDPYLRWLIGQSLAPNQLEPTSDPDADGYPNLLEFVFGTSPIDTASAPDPEPVLVPRGAFTSLGFEFVRPRSAGSVMLELHASEDLVHWQPIPTGVESRPLDDSTELVRAYDPTPIIQRSRRFLRLGAVPSPAAE